MEHPDYYVWNKMEKSISQKKVLFFVLFDLILYVLLTIFQLDRDESSWVEPVLS